MKTINYTLPEFAFLDGNSHEGDTLEGRTVIQHLLTHTVMEVVDLSELKVYSFSKPTFEFEYVNKFAVVEKHMLVLHFSVFHDIGEIDNEQLKDIFEKSAIWYCDYLAWEDSNIDRDQELK